MPQSSFIATNHDPLLVGVSLGVAILASWVTLDLARRVRNTDPSRRAWWWGGGALVLGTGVWSMHFVAMLGLNLGIRLGYAWGPTAVSWLAAVAAAGVAFWVAAQARLNSRLLTVGATAMAAGICGMHYIGMSALELAPGIVWSPVLVAASVVVAWVASAAALAIFFGLARLSGRRRRRMQGVAAVVMGLAVVGMHYTGMAAARFPEGVLCLTADQLGGKPLAVLVTGATALLLLAATLVSTNEKLRISRERRLNRSLHETNLQLLEANAQLTRRAFTDALTGLPNRSLFEDRLQHALARVAERRRREGATDSLAVIMLNLDGFKPVNESFGHSFGDRLLQVVGTRLQRDAREADTVARLDSDQFAVLLEGAQAGPAADVMARRLLDALALPYQLSGQDVRLSASAGIALYPASDASGQRLLACATSAMQAAKASGGGGCMLFDASMAEDVTEQVQLQQALRVALQQGELALHFQPKLKADSGELHGLEALLRWRHPTRGMISPAVFVPLAERFGLIGRIGNWVIEEACRQLGQWHAQGLRCRVAINLSPHQLRQPDLADRIRESLQRHGLHPAFLVCEMTETAAMEHFQQAGTALQRLIDVGVMLSIDDFGTGHSSLGQLRRIPARQLKVDRSFVRDLEEDPRAVAVLDAVVRLAHALGMEVVAEGVETEQQHRLLRELRCDVVQGFFFAKPMPPEDVQSWVQARQPEPAADSDGASRWAI